MVDREVLVAEFRAQFVGVLEALARLGREAGLRAADGARFARHLLVERRGDGDGVEVGGDQQGTRDAVGVVEQRQQEVRRA